MPTKRDKRLFGLAELLAAELNKSKGDVQPEDIVSFMQCNVPISEEESSEEYDDMMKDRLARPAGRGTSAMARLRKSLGFADGDSLISVLEKAAEFAEKQNTPLQIVLGEGRVMITGFTDPDGFGIMFRDSGSRHEIGALTGEKPGVHTPQPGEVYVKCHNRASALVLMEQVAWVVAQYHEAE